MLKTLAIENIALIEKLELELGSGLNILSGETGAGKSIIIDSLNFVLGERADKSLIRYGAAFSTVEAVFENYGTPSVDTYLDGCGIEPEDVLILRRKMTVDGKNECRVNGKQVTLSVLKGLTELLADIHGQHEHQSLLRPAGHINLLDNTGGADVLRQRDAVKAAYACYTDIKTELERLGDSEERERKLDVLKYQIEEIEKAAVEDGEEDELLEKRKRIRNSEKILNALNSAADDLNENNNSAVQSLKNAAAALKTISVYDDRTDGLVERLESAKAEILDIADTVSDMLDELSFDGNTAEAVEERLEKVRSVTRKYGGGYEALTAFYNSAKAETETLVNAADIVVDLEKQLETTGENLEKSAKNLTKTRTELAAVFEKKVLCELGDLGMKGSTFKVDIKTVDGIDGIRADGADSVEFLISPNVGEPLKPLSKIISGGEMSRFMLALKNITAGIDMIGTMVFDEIDTGISGNIAEVVAEKMCNISRDRQVIAVTHMSPLASMADFHYLIEKNVEDGKTLTRVRLLDDDTEEIARLLGGSGFSSHAVPHALEMKANAEKYKCALKNNATLLKSRT